MSVRVRVSRLPPRAPARGSARTGAGSTGCTPVTTADVHPADRDTGPGPLPRRVGSSASGHAALDRPRLGRRGPSCRVRASRSTAPPRPAPRVRARLRVLLHADEVKAATTREGIGPRARVRRPTAVDLTAAERSRSRPRSRPRSIRFRTPRRRDQASFIDIVRRRSAGRVETISDFVDACAPTATADLLSSQRGRTTSRWAHHVNRG